jgi:hypothetical protein
MMASRIPASSLRSVASSAAYCSSVML